LTGDQRHRNDITNGQQVSRHSFPALLCFNFFCQRTKYFEILWQPANGTFGFTPTHNTDPSAKPKEPFLANALNEILLTTQTCQMYFGKFEIANK